jgi:hypothetical protein
MCHNAARHLLDLFLHSLLDLKTQNAANFEEHLNAHKVAKRFEFNTFGLITVKHLIAGSSLKNE